MKQRALAAQVSQSAGPCVVEAALWCFWHGDDSASGEVLLGLLLGRDERVRLVYGLLVGAFYMGEPFKLE
ncbi:ADP-ribosylglycohydrolase [Aeromonas veronii]